MRFEVAVPAGWPSPAEDYYDGPLDLGAHLVPHPAATYIVRVAGSSMVGAGIYDGDELIVDRALTPSDGRIVVAVLGGEITVKRLHRKNGRVRLIAENPEFPDIVISEGDDFTVWGVVRTVIHHV